MRLETWDGEAIGGPVPISFRLIVDGGVRAIAGTSPGDCFELMLVVYTDENERAFSSSRISVSLGTECQPALLHSMGFSDTTASDLACSDSLKNEEYGALVDCRTQFFRRFIHSSPNLRFEGLVPVGVFDLDSDGDADALSLSDSGIYRALIQEEGEAFHAVEGVGPVGRINESELAFGDLNGDGNIDIVGVSSNMTGSKVSRRRTLWLNDETGRFEPSSELIGPELRETSGLLETNLVDLDADGDLDVFGYKRGAGPIAGQSVPSDGAVSLNDGTARFSLASRPTSETLLAMVYQTGSMK